MIAKTVVNRPTTVMILFVLLFLLGLYSFSNLALDLFPEIDFPVLLVTDNYSSAGPQEIEYSITRPLEGLLSSVSKVEKITSTSSKGTSLITLQFKYGTDMADAANNVRDSLARAKNFLPADAEAPTILKFDTSQIPILTLSVLGNRSQEELRDIAENTIQGRLQQVDGVSRVSVSGGRIKAVLVQISQNRLEAYSLNLTQISNALRGQNTDVSAGQITQGNTTYVVQTSGTFKSLDEIGATVVAIRGSGANQRVIRIRDIGDVIQGYKPADDAVFVNGKPGVMMSVLKQGGANSVKTADNVKARLIKLKQELPNDISVVPITDSTKFIRSSIGDVVEGGVYGIILAVIVLLFFLRSIKSTLIISTAIPVSVIITLAAMYFAGMTLNIMTLAGLTLGIGRLLDDSIVILENIYRYREKGATPKAAAINGTAEMMVAILASTLTTVCVFAPMLMFGSGLGVLGQMVSGLVFTIIISLLSSLLVAMVLVPVLASRYLTIYTHAQRPLTGISKGVDGFLTGALNGLDAGYKKFLAVLLRRRKTTIGLVALALVGSLALIPQLGFEFTPAQAQNSVGLSVQLPVGSRLEMTRDVLQQLEQIARTELKGIDSISVSAGGREFFGLGAVNTNTGTLTITLPDAKQQIDSYDTMRAKLRKHFQDFPSATITFAANQGFGSASPLDVVIKTADFDLGTNTALKIRDLIKKNVPEATEPTTDSSNGRPQIDIVVDRDRAQAMGLTLAGIGTEVRANIDGLVSGQISQGAHDTDIVVILDPADRVVSDDLNRIFVNSPTGQKVSLSSVADLKTTSGPVTIKRENQSRTFHVTAGLVPGAKLSEVVAKIQGLIQKEIPADDNLIITFSGDFEDLAKTGSQFMLIMLIAILLVYGVMAAQFESFLDPFIILFTIPLTIIGIVITYLISGEAISMFTAMGMLMLIGIVTNNGIVMLSYTNTLRRRGYELIPAMIESGGHRLRPILMTALSFILALIPVAYSHSEGASLIKPIARAMVGGMTASTVLMLVFVPTLYVVFHVRKQKADEKKKVREEKRLLKMRELRETAEGGQK